MNIFYDDKRKKWKSGCQEKLVIGKNQLPIINQKNPSGKSFYVKKTSGDSSEISPGDRSEISLGDRFYVKKVGDKVGPLIGILTSKENRRDFYGNRTTFKRIQHYLQSYGGISFVMTPEGVHHNVVDGYLFDDGKWKEMQFPLPDIIYNRVASYKAERGKGMATVRALARKYAIPFYNPHFFEKWETYTHLRTNLKIAEHLPKTDVLTSKNQLNKWLQQYGAVFIKPTLSNRGDGIVVITAFDAGYELATNSKKQQYACLDEVWAEIKQRFKKRKVIIQEKIMLSQFEGRPFDFRILVQRLKDVWRISGIGVRCAGENSVTTHVPKGGSILPLENVLDQLNMDTVNDLATMIAYQLERTYGYLCEFSIDLGVDQKNGIWLFEVNSKPMKFDEPHIQEKALHGLVQCFYEDAGFEF